MNNFFLILKDGIKGAWCIMSKVFEIIIYDNNYYNSSEAIEIRSSIEFKRKLNKWLSIRNKYNICTSFEITLRDGKKIKIH